MLYTFITKQPDLEKDRIILGIDPGTNILGYGIIHEKGKQLEVVVADVLSMSRISDHGLKLQKIYECVSALIEEHCADELAIEAPFFGKNVQSMLKLGRAQGVAIAAAIGRGIPYTEYAPRKIKQSITGNGNASKEQVAAMIKTLLKMKELPAKLDATDALGAAVCHALQNGNNNKTKGFSGWDSFLKANPGRKG